jgi:beta-glucosidase
LAFTAIAATAEETLLFRDTTKPVDERVRDLISRLTLEEKAMLLDHRGPTLERFNIRSDQWNQCLNGVKWDRPTTLFPICLAMAATWDTNLVHEVANVLSDEARAIYNGWHLDPKAEGEHKGLIYRAPVINIERNPYWGRNHEAWGEDPYLCGRMAVAYVRGLQGDDPKFLKIAATLKHYAVNNVEANRQSLNAVVSERMLREYWLPHFREAVVEGGAMSLMASYNAINGTPNNVNRWLLTELLKNEWKHEGFVVSDLGGVRTMVTGHEKGGMTYEDAVAKSVMAGCDFSDKEYAANIPSAVRNGKLTMERLDDALFRVLRVRFLLGEFDAFESGPYSKIPPDVVCSPAHRAVALKAAQKSIVLLKNEKNVLPLDRSKLKRIAVIGPLADCVVLNNYNGKPGETVTALQGIKDRAGAGVEVLVARGCAVSAGGGTVETKVDKEAGFSGGKSLKLDANSAGEFIEFAINVPAPGKYEISLTYKSFLSRGIYRLGIDGAEQGGPVDMFATKGEYDRTASFGTKTFDKAGVKQFRFTSNGKNPASSGFSGHFDRIVLTGPKEVAIEVEQAKFVTGGGSEATEIGKAADAARNADIAIVFVGTDASVEQEARDRKTLGLTGAQEELVKAVFAANPKTIVVQMSAGPLTVPWLKENIPAMLQAWWPGEEGGHAIADILFGDANPAGRLPHTVYASEAQVPPQDEYDITKGYTYMYVNGDPLFAFGHGLSYTQFKYSNFRLSSEKISARENVTATVDVENTGTRAGDEVVQLYTRAIAPSVKRPAKELRGFVRIALKPGEKKSVTLAIPAEKLAFWDEKTHRFLVEPGDHEISVGASSSDIRATSRLAVFQ